MFKKTNTQLATWQITLPTHKKFWWNGWSVSSFQVHYLTGEFLYISRAFDVDMLFLAQYFNIPVGEVAINWTEIEGMGNLSTS